MSAELRPYGRRISVVDPPDNELGRGLYLPAHMHEVKCGIVVAVSVELEADFELAQRVWYRAGCGSTILRRAEDHTDRITVLDADCVVAVED